MPSSPRPSQSAITTVPINMKGRADTLPLLAYLVDLDDLLFLAQQVDRDTHPPRCGLQKRKGIETHTVSMQKNLFCEQCLYTYPS